MKTVKFYKTIIKETEDCFDQAFRSAENLKAGNPIDNKVEPKNKNKLVFKKK